MNSVKCNLEAVGLGPFSIQLKIIHHYPNECCVERHTPFKKVRKHCRPKAKVSCHLNKPEDTGGRMETKTKRDREVKRTVIQFKRAHLIVGYYIPTYR